MLISILSNSYNIPLISLFLKIAFVINMHFSKVSIIKYYHLIIYHDFVTVTMDICD